MRFLAAGTTILELIIYISLLGIVAAIGFGMVWQVRQKNQAALMAHTNLSTTRVALELLARDICASQSLELKRNHKLNLACKTEMGTVQWQLNNEGELLRTDHQMKHKKPAISKVAENITIVTITPVGQADDLQKAQKLVKRVFQKAKCIQIAIRTEKERPIFRKTVTLRKTICI